MWKQFVRKEGRYISCKVCYNLSTMKYPEKISDQTPPPPKVGIFESPSGKLIERHFDAIKDDNIRNPYDMSVGERSAELATAREKIIGNEELEKFVIKAFLNPGNVLPYARLTNKITEVCVSLTDAEIDSIVNQFKARLRENADKYAKEFGLSAQQIQNLKTNMWNSRSPQAALNPGGIKAVAHFVQARKLLHSASPKTFPAFYFENYLDAQHGIDLIEVLQEGEEITINLIQIKSYEYDDDEVTRYTETHRKWAREYMTDMNTYEASFFSKPKAEKLKIFLDNLDGINDWFIETLTDPKPNNNKMLLFETIGLGAFTKPEQMWVLQNYLPVLKLAFNSFVSENEIGDDVSSSIHTAISDLENRLANVMEQKNNLQGISKIYSICACDKKESSKTLIFESDNPEKRKVIKIS